MKPEYWQRLKALYEAALERSAEEREPFLVEACAGDADLLAELRAMLATPGEGSTAADASPFLSPPTRGPRTNAAAEADAGTRVGSFVLGEPLASGGMGTVYEAWQEEPRRKVALKLLRAGSVSDSAVRRFRFEAELLAKLHHPGIAPIHEAGVHRADDGTETPYLAMELVEDARDILSSARARGLDLRGRLELLLQVCAAVQHGHQHGVVHRDLKPANILVDAQGHVRVIDFGIARAVGGDGPEEFARPETQFTAAGEILGTLGYMSPEQFAGDSAAIDTRSDVYSLGVVLHELVCGRPPFDLAGRSLLEITRTVCEQPATLPDEVPEDLGWVLLKALAKDPEERYASASELAADLERFLADAPVEAGAPSSTYRLRKFVRRNRVAVAFSGLAAAGLVVGASTALVGLLQAKAAQKDLALERDVAQDEADKFASINRVLGGMFLSVTPDQEGRDVRVADLLDRSSAELGTVGDPQVAAPLRRVVGRAYGSLGLRDEAIAELEVARDLLLASTAPDPRELARVRADLATMLTAAGRTGEALAIADVGTTDAEADLGADDPAVFELIVARARAQIRERGHADVPESLAAAVRRAEDRLGPEDLVTLDLREQWGLALAAEGRHAEAHDVLSESVERESRVHGPRGTRTLNARYRAALLLKPLGRIEEGLAELEALLPLFEATFGADSAVSCKVMASLAELATNVGRYEDAYALLEAALPCLERTLAPSSMDLITARGNFAALLDRMDDDRGSLAVRRAAWEAARRYFGPDDLRTLDHQHGTAIQLIKEGRNAEAAELAEHVARVREAELGPDDPNTLEAREIQARAWMNEGRLEEALAVQRDVLERRTRTIGPENGATIRVHNDVTSSLADLGRLEEALEEGARMLAVHRRAVPDSHPSRLILLGNLGSYAFELDQHDLALEYLARAYELACTHLPAEHLDRLYATVDLGDLLSRTGESEECLPLLREAIETLELSPAARPGLRARAHRRLGLALVDLGRTEEGRAELERALPFFERLGDAAARAAIVDVLEGLPDGGD